MVGSGFAGAIWTARIVRRVFIKRRIAGRERAKHLIGRNMMKSFECIIFRGLEQIVRAHNIGMNKSGAIQNRTIDMRLGGKMYNRVHLFYQIIHQIFISDIPFYESITRVFFNVT